MDFTIPSPETLQQFEKLGIVGILLLVQFTALGLAVYVGNKVFGWMKAHGEQVLEQLSKQTVALENVKQSNASMEVGQSRLNERWDRLFICPARPCPMRPSDHILQPNPLNSNSQQP